MKYLYLELCNSNNSKKQEVEKFAANLIEASCDKLFTT